MASATKTFEYQVRDRGGKVVTGKLDAPNQAAVVVKLKEKAAGRHQPHYYNSRL